LGVSPGSHLQTPEEYDNGFPWAVPDALNGSGLQLGLRAALAARVPPLPEQDPPPANWPGYAIARRYSFVSAFDPSARVRTASLTWRALFGAAKRAGAPSPASEPSPNETFPALPVLGLNAGEVDGLVLDDGAPVWLHAAGAIEAFSVGERANDAKFISAVARAPHSLVLLSVDADGLQDITEVVSGTAHRLARIPGLGEALYPANPDALVVGPKGKIRPCSGMKTGARRHFLRGPNSFSRTRRNAARRRTTTVRCCKRTTPGCA
jgi:hypothetical protein